MRKLFAVLFLACSLPAFSSEPAGSSEAEDLALMLNLVENSLSLTNSSAETIEDFKSWQTKGDESLKASEASVTTLVELDQNESESLASFEVALENLQTNNEETGDTLENSKGIIDNSDETLKNSETLFIDTFWGKVTIYVMVPTAAAGLGFLAGYLAATL